MAQIQLVHDEVSRRITDVIVDGNSITKKSKQFTTGKSFLNALKKAQETPYWREYTSPKRCYNQVSGVGVELTGFEASIFEWCMNWYRRYERGEMAVPIQTFDNMKYFLLALNASAYFDLLD